MARQPLSKALEVLGLIVVFTIVVALAISFFAYGFLFATAFELGWGLSIGETSSLALASAAFLTAAYQTYMSRQHNRVSVRPKIKIIPSLAHKSSDTIGIFVKNQGIGPAIIEDLTLSRLDKQGRLVDKSFKAVVPNWCKDYVRFEAIGNGSSLPANDGSWIVETASKNYSDFFSELSGLTVEVVYRSMYNERYKSACMIQIKSVSDEIVINLSDIKLHSRPR